MPAWVVCDVLYTTALCLSISRLNKTPNGVVFFFFFQQHIKVEAMVSFSRMCLRPLGSTGMQHSNHVYNGCTHLTKMQAQTQAIFQCTNGMSQHSTSTDVHAKHAHLNVVLNAHAT